MKPAPGPPRIDAARRALYMAGHDLVIHTVVQHRSVDDPRRKAPPP